MPKLLATLLTLLDPYVPSTRQEELFPRIEALLKRHMITQKAADTRSSRNAVPMQTLMRQLREYKFRSKTLYQQLREAQSENKKLRIENAQLTNRVMDLETKHGILEVQMDKS